MKILYRKLFLFLMCFGFAFKSLAQEVKVNTNETQAEKIERKIMIPTAFSPNGDGMNDVFKLVNVTNEVLIDFKVFNRWGTVLFTTKDINSGWDGNYKGQQEPFGVYGYVIKIKYDDNVEEIYKGTVTLIR